MEGMMLLPLVLVFLSMSLQAHGQNHILAKGSFLTPSSPPLTSPSSIFSLSFLPSSPSSPKQLYLAISFTVSRLGPPVWTANRATPVSPSANLTISSSGDLTLSDPSISSSPIWASHTSGLGDITGAMLLDSGNLVLVNSMPAYVWQSFAHPTDTLLPGQPFASGSKLVSSKRIGNFGPGRYALAFNTNTWTLQLSYTSSSSSYWDLGGPGSAFLQFDQLGNISLYSSASSVDSTSITNDYGSPTPLRRITLDVDGNLRMYTWDIASKQWKSVWLAFTDMCTRVLGLCGSYGVCKYDPQPKCVCPRGFSVVDAGDLSQGCHPNNPVDNCGDVKFLEMEGLDYPFNNYREFTGATEERCKQECANDCSCRAAVYWQSGDGHCWLKEIVQNGYRSGNQLHRVFLRVSNLEPLVSTPLLDNPTQWSSQSLF